MKTKSEDPFYQQIQREINRIEKKADTYIILFYTIRIIQILFAGTITVISGMKDKFDDDITIILFLGAVTTVVTAIDTLFQIDAKKNTYKLVLFELRTIRAELVFNEIVDSNPEKKIKYAELYEKYRKANSYSRDLIGTDTERENTQNAPAPRHA